MTVNLGEQGATLFIVASSSRRWDKTLCIHAVEGNEGLQRKALTERVSPTTKKAVPNKPSCTLLSAP